MIRSVIRRPLAALAVLSPLVALASFSATVVSTDLQMPGTEPGELAALFEPANCFTCHANYDPAVEPGRNWPGSMLPHASRGPLCWGAMAVGEQTVDGSGDLCLPLPRREQPAGGGCDTSPPRVGVGGPILRAAR